MVVGNLFDGVITVVIAVILIVNVALPTIKGANQATWTQTEKDLYGNNSLFLFIGLLLLIARIFIMGSYFKSPMAVKSLSPPR
jgi:hypothetical protein